MNLEIEMQAFQHTFGDLLVKLYRRTSSISRVSAFAGKYPNALIAFAVVLSLPDLQ